MDKAVASLEVLELLPKGFRGNRQRDLFARPTPVEFLTSSNFVVSHRESRLEAREPQR